MLELQRKTWRKQKRYAQMSNTLVVHMEDIKDTAIKWFVQPSPSSLKSPSSEGTRWCLLFGKASERVGASALATRLQPGVTPSQSPLQFSLQKTPFFHFFNLFLHT